MRYKDIVLSAHQPQYMPYLGYFHKMKNSDVFVILDDVQFKKNEWQNRNRVKGKDGEVWITVPVFHKFGQKINEVIIRNDIPWQRKNKNTIITYYSKARYFHLFQRFDVIWQKEYEKLLDVNMDSINIIRDILKINTPMFFSSELKINKTKTDRLVAICKEFSAKYYLSGKGAKGYLEEEKFRKEGIEVIWQDFNHPVYTQLWGDFIPNLSAIDLILNEGEDGRRFLE
ncbi:hypothetical protein HRbin19_00030 [bacterium HR19]|nr:hypothetical protein HRbin19_00030 [bacterium HR19]